MGAADDPDRGLEADKAIDAGGAGDRAVGLGADGAPCEPRRYRRPAARGRAAGIAIDGIGVLRQPADRAPPAGRIVRADIGPLGQVGLAQHHAAVLAKQCNHRRIAAGGVIGQREAAGGGRPLGGLDIVLHQHRAPAQRLFRLGDRNGGRIGVIGYHRIEHRSGIVERADALDLRSGGGIGCCFLRQRGHGGGGKQQGEGRTGQSAIGHHPDVPRRRLGSRGKTPPISRQFT